MTATASTTAATDVGEFITELDGGVFDRKLSIALSQVAAAAVDHDKEGEVNIKFSFKKIPGTHQVHCAHTLKFTRPTLDGKSSEEEKRTTPLFVGKFGKLTLAPENQLSFLDKAGNTN
jgi:hypothetical protein